MDKHQYGDKSEPPVCKNNENPDEFIGFHKNRYCSLSVNEYNQTIFSGVLCDALQYTLYTTIILGQHKQPVQSSWFS